MKNTLLQFSATLLFGIVGLTASSQTSWLTTGNSNTTNTNFIGTKNAQPLIFKTNNLERMRITKNGQIGIGVTNPSQTLQVTTSSFTTAISGFSTVAGGNGLIAECDNGTGGASPFGVWGLCSNTTTGFAGVFNGNVTISSILTQASDQRLKENIKR